MNDTEIEDAAQNAIDFKIQRLDEIARASDKLESEAIFETEDGDGMNVSAKFSASIIQKGFSSRLYDFYLGDKKTNKRTMAEGLFFLGEALNGKALRLARISAKGRKSPVSDKDLTALVTEIWCELCGVPVPTDKELKDEKARGALRLKSFYLNELRDELRSAPEEIRMWNERWHTEADGELSHKNSDFKGTNLAGARMSLSHYKGPRLEFQSSNFDQSTMTCDTYFFHCALHSCTFRNASMDGVNIRDCTAHGADFSGSSLMKANLQGTEFSSAIFRSADLIEANFSRCDLAGANFQDADLTAANLTFCDLRGTDLSSAKLDKALFQDTKYDEKTSWPTNFVPPDEGLWWTGEGKDSLAAVRLKALVPQGAIDFDIFMDNLDELIELERIDKALEMLRKEKFQLFSEVTPDFVNGVVKSQTDKELAYACRIAMDGEYSCCTQNLFACGGLRGSLCKHLVVLVVGLTKAGKLDAQSACELLIASRPRKPSLNKQIASETFLRYKGAIVGEIDWRPTETIPEDYYAF